ncbi:RES family NAD+ phosphorylase [Lichenihabitans psoromatis]|uniref:RES family NAD+ phosphorylase n=1 Tax=Lichenihabitans psoromatis TaxID=2528642 RepID=UPI00103672B2|nr:RES family NAD+ phosphorylase [Lichenihabitans psoromatis]
MPLDPAIIASLTRRFQPTEYLRTTPWAFRSTPLGMGFGKTRFASPADAFKLIYVAEDLPTSIAEAIVRDRFEGKTTRELARSDVADWGVCEVSARAPLRVLNLRGNGCFELGVSTDIVGAKSQDEARDFSQTVHDTTDLDGILYRSRLRKEQDCVAVYERAVSPKLAAGAVVQMESLAGLIPALRALKIKLI